MMQVTRCSINILDVTNFNEVHFKNVTNNFVTDVYSICQDQKKKKKREKEKFCINLNHDEKNNCKTYVCLQQ